MLVGWDGDLACAEGGVGEGGVVEVGGGGGGGDVAGTCAAASEEGGGGGWVIGGGWGVVGHFSCGGREGRGADCEDFRG